MATSSARETIIVDLPCNIQDAGSKDNDEEDNNHEGNEQKETSRKHHYRWNPGRYIPLLRIIILRSPFSAPHKTKRVAWDKVAQDYNAAMKEPSAITGRKAKEKFDDLLAIFRKEEVESLHKSGTNEEYTELDTLLEELDELERDFRAEDEALKKKVNNILINHACKNL